MTTAIIIAIVAAFGIGIDDDVRARFFINFVVNSALIGQHRSEKVKEANSCNAPYAILLDPTSGCNLSVLCFYSSVRRYVQGGRAMHCPKCIEPIPDDSSFLRKKTSQSESPNIAHP